MGQEKSSLVYRRELGASLRVARGTLGWTQDQVAEALEGVGRGDVVSKRKAVSEWERGKSLPGPVYMVALRELFGPALVEPREPMGTDERGYLRGRAEQIALHIEDLLRRQRDFVESIGTHSTEAPTPIEAGATESVHDEPIQQKRKGGQR